MKTNKSGSGCKIGHAFRLVLLDLRNLVKSSVHFLVTLLKAVPRDVLIYMLLISLAVIERQITMGVFDRWLA